MEKEDVYLLELEERLSLDNDGSFKKELEEKLLEWESRVRRHIDKGLPPDEFSRYDLIRQALGTAREVVDRVWELTHK